jgi:hypothetical protein
MRKGWNTTARISVFPFYFLFLLTVFCYEDFVPRCGQTARDGHGKVWASSKEKDPAEIKESERYFLT